MNDFMESCASLQDIWNLSDIPHATDVLWENAEGWTFCPSLATSGTSHLICVLCFIDTLGVDLSLGALTAPVTLKHI